MKRFTQIVGTGRTLYVDVDETLIRPAPNIDGAVNVGGFPFEVLDRNVDTLRRFAANADTTIIVWSAGGAIWADQVVEALGLTDCVDVCLSKPTWYLDDRRDAGFALNDDAWIDANRAS